MFSLSAVAARLRDGDPLFDQLSNKEKRRAAKDLITLLGGDADDRLTVALLMAPPEARRVAGEVAGLSSGDVVPLAPSLGPPLIARFMAATRLTDSQTAAILNLSRPIVNLWKNGRATERYTDTQRKALALTAREQLDAISAVLELLEDRHADQAERRD